MKDIIDLIIKNCKITVNIMKVFEKDGKINFVDENNVFVGYDYSQDCCESFGYFISDKILDSIPEKIENKNDFDLEDYIFDIDFIQENLLKGIDEGGSVTFKLQKLWLNRGAADLYLCLFNSHNGYYGHGFTIDIEDKTFRTGTL